MGFYLPLVACLSAVPGREEQEEHESAPSKKQMRMTPEKQKKRYSVVLTSVKSEHAKTFHCEGGCSLLES